MSQPRPRKLLLIGWDAADWKIITPLLDQGLMPTLDSFLNDGVMGNIATLQPILSPMLWNSIATGKRPEKHGIHGFMEPDPQTGGVRPVTSTSRRVKAIWNILTQKGYRTHVLGWFAGHPAEPINGIGVSDLFPYATAPLDQSWPVPPGTIHPERLRDTFAGLRMHPSEVQPSAILPIIPLAAKVDQEKDKRLSTFAKIVAENCSIHNAATWILEHEEWDFLAVYYNGIDHFCHGFMHFHPPQLEGIPDDLFEIYQGAVNGAYRFHDMLLDRLLSLVPPDTTVMIVSDHGFYSDHLRPRGIPDEPAGPAVQHRPLGIFCMKGPGILKDERIYGATLLDVTPTILTLYGLPVAEDMDGRVLVQAFEEPLQIERIASWEQVDGECGMHPADLRMDPAASQAVLQQFVALGYIQPPSADQEKAVANAIRELNYNLARSLMDARKPAGALPLLETLTKEWPEEARFRQHLAHCYLALGRRDEAKTILQPLIAESRPWSDWMMGVILYGEGNFEASLECLLRAGKAEPHLPNLHLSLGNTYLRMARLADAERAFRKALEIDGESPDAFLGLASVNLRQRRNEDAAENALIAVGLQHFLPGGHFYLGVAVARLGHYDRAVVAFETALSMLPGLLNAHRWLAAIHSRPGGDTLKARRHRRIAREMWRQRRTRS